MIQIRPMEAIDFSPNLFHCIESAAREEFWTSVSQYMGGWQTDKKPEERIKLLRAFLNSADFKKLRSQSEKHIVERKKEGSKQGQSCNLLEEGRAKLHNDGDRGVTSVKTQRVHLLSFRPLRFCRIKATA
jgi:hypothetical protein